MLDPDISTRDALRLLTAPDDDPRVMDRRRFLQLVGYGVGAGLAVGAIDELVPARVREAWAATPAGAHDGILVLVGQFGGSDGLNVVVPYTNPLYYAQHGSLAIPGSKTLHLNSSVGLHSSLPYLKSLYDHGHVAVVQGVGYPNPDLSHFSSMAYWMSGHKGAEALTTGWVGRWLDGLSGSGLFRGVEIGQGLPLHMIGSKTRGISVPEWGGGFGSGGRESDKWMFTALRSLAAAPSGRGPWNDAVASTVRGMIDVGQTVGPMFERPLPDDSLEKKMTVAARLINADIGLRVLDTGFDGFDTHSGQPQDLADLMAQFDRSLKAFFTALDDRFRSRVTIMTYSEFGRTSYSNDSAGTDHGTVNNHFVIGQGVKGGLYGHQPSLAGLDRWDRMVHHVDFRSMYASVLDGWMGGGSSTVLGATYPNLGLFAHGPGAGVASGVVPPTVVGDYVSLATARLYDSRSSRLLPLGAGTTAEVQVLGKGGIPIKGVSAVVLHVTAVGATEPSTFTVWPTGGARPDIADVVVPAVRSQPALVMVKVGRSGRVNVFNDSGAAHCVVDVVGYFRTTAANRLQTTAPWRALDTRTGVGGPKSSFAPGATRAVRVRGLHGVPSTADSVVVNVTVATPTAAGALTVWASGAPRPNATSMSFAKATTTPHLMIAKVGTDGKIAVRNTSGKTHVVIDVIGYMSKSAKGRFVPLAPGRVYSVTGQATAPVQVPILGQKGVPSAGVQAVVLNVVARAATGASKVTVWSTGSAQPSSGTLNPAKGLDVSNTAIVRPGTAGKVNVANSAGTVDIDIDVVGYFTK